MKKFFAFLLCAAMIASVLTGSVLAQDAPLSGAGTQDDPYRIDTLQALTLAAELVETQPDLYAGAAYVLESDLKLNTDAFAGIGTEDAPFTGSFDGKAHTVSGLHGSLFGVCTGAEVKDLSVTGANAAEGGILCKTADTCTFEDCAVSGTSEGCGICGTAKNTTFLRCRNDAEVSGADCAGGIAGISAHSRFLLCENSGTVTAAQTAGGIVGTSGPGDEAALCLNRGEIRSDGTAGGICGTADAIGLVGLRNAYIMSANVGTVTAAQPDETADWLGLPLTEDCSRILLISCYTTGESGGSYHGIGEYDESAGETVTEGGSSYWEPAHRNETVSGISDEEMKSDLFPALVNDGYAYVLEGNLYQFAADKGGTNDGYPVIVLKKPAEVTGDAEHAAYVNGTGDGMFSPTKAMTRAELAQMIYGILSDLEKGETTFTDVPDDGKWYVDAVNALAKAGILSGYPDGSFGPNRLVMRCELVQVLAMVSGETLGGRVADFTDVKENFWAYDVIALAQERGWVKGVGDGSFAPNRNLTRAEAVTAINSFLGRVPDQAAINANAFARFFPDVQPGTWYYYQVMEAAVTHTMLSTNEDERWINVTQYGTELSEGFWLVGGKLYLVQEGRFVLDGSGEYQGVSYACEDGVCSVSGDFVTLSNGEICILKDDGTPWCGRGLFEYEGNWYYGSADGTLLRNGTWQTMRFDKDGKYTSGNATIDSYVDGIIASVTDDTMTQEEKLKACYNYVYSHIVYQSNNNHVPHGADESTWTEEYMLRLIERGKGNCYCFASEMYYLARRLGYWQAHAVSGQDAPDGYAVDHGWVEIAVGDTTCLCDPEMNKTRNLKPYALFMIPYSAAPWKYYPY